MLAPEDLDTMAARETSDVIGKLDEIKQAIIANKIADPGTFGITTVPQATHVRMRIKSLVLSADNAGAVNIRLTIGTRLFVFPVIGPITLVLPPPVDILDRGVDIFATTSVGALQASYLTYTPE